MKHFTSGNLIDLSRVDWERKLVEILAEKVPTDHDAQEVVTGSIV